MKKIYHIVWSFFRLRDAQKRCFGLVREESFLSRKNAHRMLVSNKIINYIKFNGEPHALRFWYESRDKETMKFRVVCF